MVVKCFQELMSGSKEIPTMTLPVFKESNIKIMYEYASDSVTIYKDKEPILPFAQSEVFMAAIICSKLVTPQLAEVCSKPVYEVTFDVKGSNYVFKPGDTIGILPHNCKEEVDDLLNHLEIGHKADMQYELSAEGQKTKIPLHVPAKSTLRHVLTNCLDIRSVVKKLFLLALSKYTKEEAERNTLKYLCSKEGSSVYNTHVLNKNLCILDIFKSFKSCKPPVEILLSYLPRLLPRPYSIINSFSKQPDIIKICFSVKELENGRKGLTTGWLEQKILNDNIETLIENLNLNKSNIDKVPIYLRKNIAEFSLKDVNSAIIMIATGTGLAPFLSFLEERYFYKSDGRKIGFSWLFFGCRNPDVDYIYKEDLHEFFSNGSLNKLSSVYSKVENGGVKYVQDGIKQNGTEVTKLLLDGAYIFICGDHRTMVSDVKNTIVNCLVEHGDKTKEDAEKFLTDMERSKRYLVDLWS